MKKKSPRGIPDFSSKRPKPKPGTPTEQPPLEKEQPVRPDNLTMRIKPPATSMKGGRRGQ